MNAKSLPGSGTLLMVGIVLVLFGALMLVSPVAFIGAVVKLVALVLIATGLAQIIQGFRGGKSTHTAVSTVLGLIVAGVGVLVALNPETGSAFLTTLLMIFFLVHGIYQFSSAVRYRSIRGWAWLFLSGLVSLVFVYLLWKQWPLSGAWAIGVLVGLELLFTGLALIILSGGARKARSTGDFDTIKL
jgi:uncharacterized membrane protein HdeD (DUF308 family)